MALKAQIGYYGLKPVHYALSKYAGLLKDPSQKRLIIRQQDGLAVKANNLYSKMPVKHLNESSARAEYKWLTGRLYDELVQFQFLLEAVNMELRERGGQGDRSKILDNHCEGLKLKAKVLNDIRSRIYEITPMFKVESGAGKELDEFLGELCEKFKASKAVVYMDDHIQLYRICHFYGYTPVEKHEFISNMSAITKYFNGKQSFCEALRDKDMPYNRFVMKFGLDNVLQFNWGFLFGGLNYDIRIIMFLLNPFEGEKVTDYLMTIAKKKIAIEKIYEEFIKRYGPAAINFQRLRHSSAVDEVQKLLKSINEFEAQLLKPDKEAAINLLKNLIDNVQVSIAKTKTWLEIIRADKGNAKFNIVNTLSSTRYLYIVKAASKGLSLRYELPDEPMEYTGNEALLSSAVCNLIENAIKYTLKGKISVKLAKDKRPMPGRGDIDVISITVSDTGIGIPDKDQEKLGDIGYRASNVENIPGTGIGMNEILSFVQYAHGKLDSKSKVGEGSTFTLIIPLE